MLINSFTCKRFDRMIHCTRRPGKKTTTFHLKDMTTKPPSTVTPSPAESLENVAYASVAGIPTVEPHDLDRLGYNVWRWLVYRRDPLDLAIRSAGARLKITEEEALRRIREGLQRNGIEL